MKKCKKREIVHEKRKERKTKQKEICLRKERALRSKNEENEAQKLQNKSDARE